jgi:hypothetical protein
MIVFVNGAFGIGKSTVARLLVACLPRAVLYDPELPGIALQHLARLFGRHVDDFQDLRLWRRLTILALRIARWFRPNVIVPMAFSNAAYLQEIRGAVTRFEPHTLHFCLIAPIDVVRERLRTRRVQPADGAWQDRRASECCELHPQPAFARHVDAAKRDVMQIADEIFRALPSGLTPPSARE